MEGARRPRVLAEIDPYSEWVRGRDFDTLIVDVTGFRKEQLKVLVEQSGSSLRVSGERAVDGRQWCHFLKRFDLPVGCDAAAVRVQLDKGMLYVQVPRPDVAAAAGAGSSDEHHPAEIREAAFGGGGTGDGDISGGGGWWIGGRGAVAQREEPHPVRRLARALGRHRQVVLNVVLAVVLLWLVAFGKNTPSAGHAKND